MGSAFTTDRRRAHISISDYWHFHFMSFTFFSFFFFYLQSTLLDIMDRQEPSTPTSAYSVVHVIYDTLGFQLTYMNHST